jgi:multiple sugar transport system ATP-binding protein
MLIDTGSFVVPVPEGRVSTYQHLVDKDVIFGIRPENIHNPEYLPFNINGAPIEAKVDVTELMGNEISLIMVSGTTNFVARVDPRTRFQMGETVQVMLDMDNFHIFDPNLDPENPRAVR